MRFLRLRSISLANKCLLLFGGAIAIVLLLALIPPWLRMGDLVRERQAEIARRLVDVWLRLDAQAQEQGLAPPPDDQGTVEYAGVRVADLKGQELDRARLEDRFIRTLLREATPDDPDALESRWEGATRRYRYGRVLFNEAGHPTRVLVLERQGDDTAVLLIVNTVYLLSAGLVVFVLALALFYFVTHRLVLSPVKALRETAEGVRQGDLSIRSSIRTGDDFEELARTFNQMLSVLEAAQEHQKSVNRALDLKLHELSEANSALFESNRVKAEFLANVSHELRTPLNAIIGFAELLLEIAERERSEGPPNPEIDKRARYQKTIASAARDLLQLIESLLEMAKIEAGRVEIRIESVQIEETCRGLIALLQPIADERRVRLVLDIERDLPALWTDPKKLHQILFNLLANAVKFAEPPPDGGQATVILRASRMLAESSDQPERIRFSVRDTGPGIPEDQLDRIFEKFHQVDAGPARRHQGTGLGLAICRELTSLLQGELTVESTLGEGSTFSLILPVRPDPVLAEEIQLERSLRASLYSPRTWQQDSGTSPGVGEVADSGP